MRRKFLIGCILLALPVSFLLFLWFTEPPPHPLPQIGMTEQEVLDQVVGKSNPVHYKTESGELHYCTPVDRYGRSKRVFVVFSEDGKVKSWTMRPELVDWRSKVWYLIGL